MSEMLFEQLVVQNTGLAAELLWCSIHEAYRASGKASGVSFPLIFLVLPLTLHRKSALSLASKTQSGAIYKAIGEDKEIVIGLQERMMGLADRTLDALSIALHTDLLILDREGEQQIYPRRMTAPVDHVTEEVRTLFKAAKRVGYAFHEMSAQQIAGHLNIRF